MATYAIGDIQGCYDPLRHLLDEIGFDPAQDTLWLTGDLVNRGPKSLRTLRFVKSLGDSAITVLGNHDLHLLALATGAIDYSARFETLKKVLDAPDVDDLVGWLRQRPLAHYSKKLDTLLVHAGTLPLWSVKKTLRRAAEVEEALQGSKCTTLLSKMYSNRPRKWSGKLSGYARLRFIINTFTRMRMLTNKVGLNFSHTGSPWRGRRDLKPWFEFHNSAIGRTRIVFGHWSALGLIVLPELVSLDTGCVWGRQLTAVRMETRVPRILQVRGQE
ncbi:MAG: symmetrical bis(5'-nucleosyl)-tetraphosphatase [Gammaproteobacteria bacterium]|nr:symmetrical bis(5'-nucleosyl)-tetraphosphatase [Gammaproteobacteria bacterium]